MVLVRVRVGSSLSGGRVSRGGKLTRGDRRRNERLTRLRSRVRRDFAVLGVDLASGKQAAALNRLRTVKVRELLR